MRRTYDVVIVGSGAAGLTAALKLAPHLRVAVLSKGEMSGGSTRWAQGGIAAVMEATDSIQSHIDDTLVAGAGLATKRQCALSLSGAGRRSTAWWVWALSLTEPLTRRKKMVTTII